MALKGYGRKIIVRDREFRWKFNTRAGGYFQKNIVGKVVILEALDKPRPLCCPVSAPPGMQIAFTPKHVRKIIDTALDMGWEPGNRQARFQGLEPFVDWFWLESLNFQDAQFKDITGRGLSALIQRPEGWTKPSHLPPVGATVKINGGTYTVLGVEYATGMGGKLVGSVVLYVEIASHSIPSDD